MRLAIIGATGGTGQELVKQALASGHSVKVLVRSPEKVTVKHDRLEVVKTDLFNESAAMLAEKLEGSEVVLSALGNRTLGITQLYSEGTKQLVAAVQHARIKRLLVISSIGTDPTDDEPRWYLWLVRRLLINTYVDMARAEQFVMDTDDLDWTIVRPPRLTNGKKTGSYRVALRYVPKGGIQISRADLADFMLKQLGGDAYVRQIPTLAY